MSPRPGISERPARILIVDDEPHNQALLEAMLEPEGFVLMTAANGEDALAIVARESPDLILLDIMMPGLDGYQVAARIKGSRATGNIPIIMVTALDDRAARMLGLKAGAEDFLTNPVDRAELCVRVRNLLRLKAYGDYYDRYSHVLEGEVGSRTLELADSERLYRSTFDAAPVGIVHIGLDGRWLKANRRMCDLLGYDCEVLQGGTGQRLLEWEQVPGEADSFHQMVAGTLDRFVIDERRYRRQDGTFILASVSTSVHRDAEGRAQHFISVIEDITDRRTLEAQVRQASKMDAIGQLASGVAHDLNNLLTVILGFAEIVRGDVPAESQTGMDLAEIIAAAHRAEGLTKQLVAFSRQQKLSAVPLDLNGLITKMTGMLGRLIGENIEVALVLSPGLRPALADGGQLEQVVMNLVVNARDAMPDGGTVTIETKEVDLENSAFHEETVVPGRYVMLAITDTGIGLTEETRRHLFEPFFTTKEVGKGTGLGLSTVYGIVKQSKGYIWVYSELGQGTVFRVYLPRSDREVPAPAVAPAHPAVRRASETVLLVEDEGGVRQLSKRILDNAGYRVLEAANGDDAEEVFSRHGASIDLVVTDVMMPGCSGPELLSRLQARAPGLRVLYMSGYAKQGQVNALGGDSRVAFVQKPFTASELVRNVREALDR